MEALKKY
jgi:hypothetical protein